MKLRALSGNVWRALSNNKRQQSNHQFPGRFHPILVLHHLTIERVQRIEHKKMQLKCRLSRQQKVLTQWKQFFSAFLISLHRSWWRLRMTNVPILDRSLLFHNECAHRFGEDAIPLLIMTDVIISSRHDWNVAKWSDVDGRWRRWICDRL